MDDSKLNKVIKALEFCNQSEDCRGCVYFTDALKGKCGCGIDALNLLKEQQQFIEFLYNHINPNEMESYVKMYHALPIPTDGKEGETE